MSKGCFELQVLVRKILEFKEKHKLTYPQIASGLDVDKSYVHKVVHFKTYPSFPVLQRLARFMEIPLCMLFLPSEAEIRGELARVIQERLDELEWSVDTLQEETQISHLRLLDILQGNVTVSAEEEKRISQALGLVGLADQYNYREIKMRLLKNFLQDMDLVENQVENVLDYIQGQM